MAGGNHVEIDWSGVSRGIHTLKIGLDRDSQRVGMSTAQKVAAQVRARVPVLTGRLRSTVRAVAVQGGGEVTYGGGLPYANKIARRTGLWNTLAGLDQIFLRAMTDAARTEVNRL